MKTTEVYLIADESGNPTYQTIFREAVVAKKKLDLLKIQYPTVYLDDTVQPFTLTRK